MNYRNFKSVLTFVILSVSGSVQAQLMVTPGQSAQQMVDVISGQNVQITNPVVTCPDGAWGLFEADVDSLSAEEGILLATGFIQNAVGPNDTESKSTAFVNAPGDPKLTLLSGYATRDACKLEFDIEPAGDSLLFEFTFASEEYNEYACTNFNDVFGFFISGPGITGDPGFSGSMNIALIPGTSTPVTINNVNHGNPAQGSACPPSNVQYHVENPLSPLAEIQYDGWTKNLVAVAQGLIPCEKYHLELIIADATDRLWDSGVFIQKIESNNVVVEVTTEGGNDVMYEACNDAVISFCLDTPVNNPTSVTYELHGSATNGVDYEAIGGTDPDFQHVVVIPAGELCSYVEINTIDDGIDEGLEFIDIIAENPLCENIILDSVRTYILDSLEVYITGDDLLCLGESTILELDSGGTSFVWSASPTVVFSPDATSDSVSISPAQTSNIIINTTIASCTAQDELLVQVSDLSLDFVVVGITCTDVCDGSIDMTINNGIAPYMITWDGMVSTEDLTDLCAGEYKVRIIDAAGCEIEATVEVGLAPPIEVVLSPSVFVGGANISCNGESDGFIDVVIVGGTAPFDTTFSAGPTDLPGGPVTVSIVDVNGCTAASTVDMLEPDPLSAVITELIPILCGGDETGSATIACTGGSGNCASILWLDTSANVVNSGPTFSDAQGGTYLVLLEDENNCTGQINVTIPEPVEDLSGIVISQNNVSCHGGDDGSLEVSGQGGTLGVGNDYQYLWLDDSSTSPIRTGLVTGVYQVVITDDNDCTVQLSVNINQPPVLGVDILIENDIQCEEQSCGNALAVASGGTPGMNPSYTYEWETVPAGMSPDFPQFSPAALFCEPGMYSVTVTDANNCKVDTTIEITIISPLITAEFEITEVLCADDSTGAIDATITGGIPPYEYLWVGGNCNQDPRTTEDIVNACAGVWCLTITDSNGCILDTCMVIDEPPALNYNFTMEPTLCSDNCSGSIDFVPVGGTPPYNYAWFGPVFPIDTSSMAFDGLDTLSMAEDLEDLCKGQYLIVLSDSLGCSFERRITVTAPEDLLILTDSVSDYNGFEVSCPDACDGWIYITATGGTVDPAYDYQFTWFEQSIGFTTQGMGTGFDDLTDLCASEDTVGYEVIIVDDNECIQNAFFIMEEPEELTFEFDVTDASCSGFSDGAVTVSVMGGVPPYIIMWTDSIGADLGGSDTIENLAEGWYFISVNDLNGCTGFDSVLISTPNPLLAPLDYVPYQGGYGVACFDDCNGTIFAPVTGGTLDYSYSWSSGDCTGPVISTEPAVLGGLCADQYSLTVTDALGCEVCETIVLTEPDILSADDAVVVDISCEGEEDGSIDLMLSGGTPAYDITWTPDLGSDDPIQTGLGEGMYTADIVDLNGCAGQFDFTINEPEELTAVAFSPLVAGGFNVSCFEGCNGSIILDIGGGTGTYDILWTGPSAPVNGGTLQTYSGVVCAGTYTATVTDGNGCIVQSTLTLSEPPAISIDWNVTIPISCNGECDGQLEITPMGGVPPFSIAWNPPIGTTGPITADDLCAGTYCVEVTDANDCVVNSCFDLQEPDVLSLSCVTSDVTCTGANNGFIDCTIQGGTEAYDIIWSGPNGFTSDQEDISNLEPGLYCVDIVDAHGCEESDCFLISEPTPLILTPSLSDYNGFGVTCLGACDGTIDASAVGGTGAYTFDPVLPVTDLCAGDYTISVTDGLGCEVMETVTITEPDGFTIDLTSPLFDCGTNVNCIGSNTGSIFSTVTGGVAGQYTYSWIDVANADTFNVGDDDAIDQLIAGTYGLYIEDVNGCFDYAEITLIEPSQSFTVDLEPSIYPGGDNISCSGACDGSITFLPTGECGDVEYSWFLGADPITDLNALCSGEYTLVAIDESECTYTDDIVFTEPAPLVVVDSVNQSLCSGDDNGSAYLMVSGGSPDYAFDWADDELDDVQDQPSLGDGTYDVTVSDFNGCSFDLEVTIDEPDSLMIFISSPVILAPDFNVSSVNGSDGFILSEVVGGTEPYTYAWTGEDGFNSPDEELANVPSGEYCLEVTDANGCMNAECIELTEPNILELPNGMSPNGDGRNDGLYIQGIEAYPDNVVKVFNRWGDEVFVRDGYNNSDQWKGESDSGGMLPDGTYFVFLVVNDGEQQLDAYLELRR